MSTAIMPKYGNGSKPVAHASAGVAEITNAEALLIAAWREQKWDVIVAMVNANCGLQLAWFDPTFDSIQGDYE